MPTDELTQAREENAALRKQLEEEQARAQAATDDFQSFVYAATHDVKEALRSVASYAQLLVRQVPPGGEFAECGKYVTDGVKTAVAILDRMNTFSRVDRHPATTFIGLAVPAQIAKLKLEAAIRTSNAQVTVGDMPEAQVSETQFTTLFEELIGNAMKFGTEKPPVIAITCEEQDSGYVLSVQDNGPGIKAEYHEVIFRPFKRLVGKEIPGVGLGLPICKKIVEAHRGSIRVESDGVRGSMFAVFLPF